MRMDRSSGASVWCAMAMARASEPQLAHSQGGVSRRGEFERVHLGHAACSHAAQHGVDQAGERHQAAIAGECNGSCHGGVGRRVEKQQLGGP